MGRPWSKRDEQRLREIYPTHTEKQCAAILARPCGSIKTKVALLGIAKQDRRVWSAADVQQLRACYPVQPTKRAAELLRRPEPSVTGKARKLGLKKSAEYLAGPYKRLISELGNGIRHRFPKGHVPANKGLRRPGWSVGRMRETQFKKGQRSANGLPVGTILPNADGYLRIKISDAPEPPGGKGASSPNWEFVHRRVWEAAHGPIPKGHRIWWKDRDHTNCALENLELLSDAEHMRRTTIQNLPPEMRHAYQLVGAVKAQITRLRKKKENRDGQEQTAGPARPPIRDTGGPQRRGEAYGD